MTGRESEKKQMKLKKAAEFNQTYNKGLWKGVVHSLNCKQDGVIQRERLLSEVAHGVAPFTSVTPVTREKPNLPVSVKKKMQSTINTHFDVFRVLESFQRSLR